MITTKWTTQKFPLPHYPEDDRKYLILGIMCNKSRLHEEIMTKLCNFAPGNAKSATILYQNYDNEDEDEYINGELHIIFYTRKNEGDIILE